LRFYWPDHREYISPASESGSHVTALPIRVDRVTKRFEATVALDDVSLEIHQGEIFGLLGPNGAGKTTLIRTILDIIKPDSGRVEVFGHPFGPEDRDRIGYLPEERGLYPREPVGAMLEYLGCLKGLAPATARAQTMNWLTRFDLADAAGKRVEQLSKGNQQKLQIAATLLARPSVVILDEPLSGLDPVSARVVNAVIREYAAAGHTVVLSTHLMSLVEALCTRVLMIASGRAVLYGNLRDIKREHSTHAVRVLSSARYEACPLVAGIDGDAAGGQPVHVRLLEAATADQFLAWLVAHGAHVERFEQLSTPLEDIFVSVVERSARVP
jgi:ABC-2 type transport system ATP-binding protein